MAEHVCFTVDGVELLVTLFINIRTTESRSAMHRSSAGRTGEGLHASLALGDLDRIQDRTQTCPKGPRGL